MAEEMTVFMHSAKLLKELSDDELAELRESFTGDAADGFGDTEITVDGATLSIRARDGGGGLSRISEIQEWFENNVGPLLKKTAKVQLWHGGDDCSFTIGSSGTAIAAAESADALEQIKALIRQLDAASLKRLHDTLATKLAQKAKRKRKGDA